MRELEERVFGKDLLKTMYTQGFFFLQFFARQCDCVKMQTDRRNTGHTHTTFVNKIFNKMKMWFEVAAQLVEDAVVVIVPCFQVGWLHRR